MSAEKIKMTARFYGIRGLIVDLTAQGKPVVQYVIDGIEYRIIEDFLS